MPASDNSSYKRPKRFISGHLETIYPALFRKVKGLKAADRERLTLSDGDFVDLDWRKQGSDRLVIVQHGLEGGSDRPYVLGMAKHFTENGYDVLAWNFRGCSGEMNKAVRFYHSGATDDMDEVVQHAIADYKKVFLVGFSLGGNMTLKYLGEASRSPKIKGAVAVSTPLDLDKGSDNLSSLRGKIYERRFLRTLIQKVKDKAAAMPGKIDVSTLNDVKTIREFDDAFTSKLHGYKNATDYYRQCSSKYFLNGIEVPTLILNAKNDPFLTPESLDHSLTEHLPNVTLETTAHGGHVGFISINPQKVYWSEQKALEFFQQL